MVGLVTLGRPSGDLDARGISADRSWQCGEHGGHVGANDYQNRLTMYWPDSPAQVDVDLRVAATAAYLDQAWAQFLGHLPWRYFVTLTFSPRKVAKVRKAVADKEARAWTSLIERMMRRPVGWLYSLERDRGGRWHSHVLVTQDVRKRVVRAANAVWTERNGRTHLGIVWEGCGAVLYTTKESRRDAEIVPSPHLSRYLDQLRGEIVIRLVRAGVPAGHAA